MWNTIFLWMLPHKQPSLDFPIVPPYTPSHALEEYETKPQDDLKYEVKFYQLIEKDIC